MSTTTMHYLPNRKLSRLLLPPSLWRRPATGLACLLLSPMIAAQSWSPEYTLHGFGTLGAVHSTQDDADFSSNLFQPNGAGNTRDISTSVDSKVGLQLDADFANDITVIAQVVSEYQYDGSYSPEVEWAFVQYHPLPELSLRAGRIVAAPFMESQTRLVSYSQTWVRLPNELYSLNPITHKQGFDARYQIPQGHLTHTVSASWGTTKENFANGANVKARDLWEFEYRLDIAATTFRLAYSNINFDLNSTELSALATGLSAFKDDPGSNGAAARDNIRLIRNRGGTYEIFAAGLQHQPNDWLLRSELAVVRTDDRTFISDTHAWYLTVGRRLGAFTPYLSVAQVKADRRDEAQLSTEGLSPEEAEQVNQLNQGVALTIDSFTFDQRSFGVGLRWDYAPGLALKLQFDHVESKDGARNIGRFVNPTGDFSAGDSANVISLSMDFVF